MEVTRQHRPSSPAVFGAVILAAGASSRMGSFKPLLELGGRTVIERLIAAFRAGGVADPCVVVGTPPPAFTALLNRLGTNQVRNPHPSDGMYSSVRVGVAALPGRVDAFFVHPADSALLCPATLRILQGAFTPDTAVVHPTFNGRRGHPPLLAAHLRDAILRFDGSDGLRGFLRTSEDRAREVDCGDPAIHLDMDTPDDYREARAMLERMRAGNASRFPGRNSSNS